MAVENRSTTSWHWLPEGPAVAEIQGLRLALGVDAQP